MTVVIGGSASGKSEYAESLVLRNPERSRIYIATMQPFGEEAHQRIARHRAMRAAKGFDTVECYTDLASVSVPQGSTVLLECMSNLCANEFFSGSGKDTADTILRGVEGLKRQCGRLIIVSNEVFSGGSRYEGETLEYLRVLAEINRRLAAMADDVCEVVCGVPVYHKGEER